MNAQDLEQRARELLAAELEAEGDQSIAIKLRRGDAGMDYSFVAALRAIVAALRHQPAPVVFRNDGNSEADFIAHHADACTACGGSGHKSDQQPAPAEVRINFPQIGTAGQFPVVDGAVTLPEATMNDLIRHARTGYVPQPAPVVDDARMARALEWVRAAARGNAGEGDLLRAALIESARKHLPAIEEAIAAYDPNCGARTVRVDDAMRVDAGRYRWLRDCDYRGDMAVHTADGRELRSGADLDSAIDAARAQGVQP